MFTVSMKDSLASSEEAFILTMVKLATGKKNVKLADLFGFCGDAMVSMIYQHMIGVLDNKTTGIVCGGMNGLRCWAHLFPSFAKIIKDKPNMPYYGGLAFDSVWLIKFLDWKFDETCAPGSGLMTDEELAEHWPLADLIQEAVYSGYVKAHGIKVLTVLFPNGITWYLYVPFQAARMILQP
jgi:hypothetical protein